MYGKVQMTVPDLARVISTRAAFGVGLGLLLANRFSSEETRRAAGWTLLLTAAVIGGSLAWELFGQPRPFTLGFGQENQSNGAAALEKVF